VRCTSESVQDLFDEFSIEVVWQPPVDILDVVLQCRNLIMKHMKRSKLVGKNTDQ
jgi:hypothetical protein